MTPATNFDVALALTAACAVLALLARALTLGGAIAGYVVGACVSIGFGLPGLAVLGTFFVVGTLATRVGWEKKKARGTAEAGEGRRDWKRVLGKGAVAAVCALLWALDIWPLDTGLAFAGSLAAALADTLGTEIGTLSTGGAWSLPTFRRVSVGTPGAVSLVGTIGAAAGAVVMAIVARRAGVAQVALYPAWMTLGIAGAGLAASLLEAVAVGLGLRAPGFLRNVLTTVVGAILAGGVCPIWVTH